MDVSWGEEGAEEREEGKGQEKENIKLMPPDPIDPDKLNVIEIYI